MQYDWIYVTMTSLVRSQHVLGIPDGQAVTRLRDTFLWARLTVELVGLSRHPR